jgi:hypothetical protein
MRFFKIAHFHWTNFGTYDISLGIHLCWSGRIDIHIGVGMLSIGVIPLYKTAKGDIIAVSNSFHNGKTKTIRHGTP